LSRELVAASYRRTAAYPLVYRQDAPKPETLTCMLYWREDLPER
jgi:hypothetical protein